MSVGSQSAIWVSGSLQVSLDTDHVLENAFQKNLCLCVLLGALLKALLKLFLCFFPAG